MKLSIFRTTIVVALISLFFGCEKPITEVDIARMNAEQYLSELLNRELVGKGSIVGYKHSDLYIFRPLDETKLPKVDTVNNEDEMIAFIKQMRNGFNSYQGISFGLSINGCDYNAIKSVIANDEEYRKYQTGAKEYLMITYVTGRDVDGLVEIEKGVCFRFNQSLDIIEVYGIEKESEDYIYVRALGEKDGHFYGAVKSEHKSLGGEYELYVKFVNDSRLGTECRYYLVNELNLLFGYQRFEVTEDKEKTIRNCIKQLNSLDDLRELKNSAYAKVKSYE